MNTSVAMEQAKAAGSVWRLRVCGRSLTWGVRGLPSHCGPERRAREQEKERSQGLCLGRGRSWEGYPGVARPAWPGDREERASEEEQDARAGAPPRGRGAGGSEGAEGSVGGGGSEGAEGPRALREQQTCGR